MREVMEDKAVLRSALNERKMTQKVLGERIGMSQSSLAQNLTRERMSVDMFTRMLDGMDYSVAVIDRRSGKVCWIVDNAK